MSRPNPIPCSERPALSVLILAMMKLSRRKRTEIARMGRKAPAAKQPRLRKLARLARAEAKRLASETA
jgi:hypothetical protein